MATGAWRKPSQNRDRCGVAKDGWGIAGIAADEKKAFDDSLDDLGHSMGDLSFFPKYP